MFAFNNAAISVLIISFSERDFRYGRERLGLSELTLIVCSDIKHGSFKSSKDQANADLLSSSIFLSFSKVFSLRFLSLIINQLLFKSSEGRDHSSKNSDSSCETLLSLFRLYLSDFLNQIPLNSMELN